jgi:hypothetical protein
LEREDQDLKSTMQICEQVIARVGKGRIDQAPVARVAGLSDVGFTLSDGASDSGSGNSGPGNSGSGSNGSGNEESPSEYTAGLSDPLSMPPPPLSPDSQPNSGRAPELLDSSSNISLPMNSSEVLSSTGGRAALRLVASPIRTRSPMVLPPTDLESAENVPLQPIDELSAKTLAGIEQLPIQELVRLLGSVQPKIAQAAALALRRHGMSDSKLELAMELATSSEERRLELLEQFPTRTDIDPRVWLLWMAQDGQSEVRGRAIAQLSSMLDQDVMRELRLLLNRERDPEIAQLIRKVLISP